MAVERTCIGCRARDVRSRLLRVVIDPSADLRVVPDPRGRLPGRGAWIHPDQGCVEHAERRRAFSRALRARGPVTITDVVALISTMGADRRSSEPPSSRKWETTDGTAMSSQR